MKTKRIALFYSLTQKDVFPPSQKELERKDEFIKTIQRSVESEYKPKMIKVTYEYYNPEVDEMRRFFHTCVMYYVIQNLELKDRKPTTEEFNQYREEILDELRGFDYQTVNKVIRKRESTKDYKEAEQWHTLLKDLEETLFEDAGYTFPDSKWFWDMVKTDGYEKAQATAITRLQAKIEKHG
jgi:hypothetical protein